MKTILLDCAGVSTAEQLHRLLAVSLQLPDWYGGNLDALFDCLTDLGEATCLLLVNTECLEALPNGYGEAFVATLQDAGQENEAFTFEIL